MALKMENAGTLSLGEFIADIRYVITSPARRLAIIHERGALWGSLVLLIVPLYFAFSWAGGVFFRREPFPGYLFIMPAVAAACSQFVKAYFIHLFGRLFEGRGRYSAATGRYRDLLVVFGYSAVPGALAVLLATLVFFFMPNQIGAALRDFRALTISIFIAFGVGLFIWNLILLVLSLRLIYPMRDLKIIATLILGTVLAGFFGFSTTAVVIPASVNYAYLEPILSARLIGFWTANPEEKPGVKSKVSVHVDRLVYKIGHPQLFDLVAYDAPVEAKGGKEDARVELRETSTFSWRLGEQAAGRIVGVPGDSVELVEGKLKINGQFWAEPYIPVEFRSSASLPLRKLGASEYLILPENRRLLESQNCSWTVPASVISGRLLVVKWPLGWALFRHTEFLHPYPLK